MSARGDGDVGFDPHGPAWAYVSFYGKHVKYVALLGHSGPMKRTNTGMRAHVELG